MREMNKTGAGFSQFYGGFDAHLAGRLSYLALRNIFYKTIYDSVKPIKLHNDLTNTEKAYIAGAAGGFASIVTAPLSLISIRQILDSQLPLEWRRNYQSVTEGLKSVRKSNQITNGLIPHVLKHVLLNIALTGPYDHFKEHLFTRFGQYGFVDPVALLIATFIGSAITLPIDNIRTKLMQQQIQHPERNRVIFKGKMSTVIDKAFLYETHPFALWAGFYTYYPSTFIYATLTVWISDKFLTSWKKKAGLLEWQM